MKTIIKIAASNSSAEKKNEADVICTGTNDEKVINEQIEKLIYGGTVKLFDGDYYFDSFSSENNTAVFFGFNEGRARVVNIVGDTENKSYNTHFGTVIHITEKALDSLENNQGHIFFGTDKKPNGENDFFNYTFINNVNFDNFYVFIANAKTPLVAIDCINFGAVYAHQVGVYTENHFKERNAHIKPESPCKGLIGFRSPRSANDELSRIGFDTVEVGGFYTGIMMCGAEHFVLKNCATARCAYGYVFNHSSKTLTMINCDDEGNTHLPLFKGAGQLTCIDFNIERFNKDMIPYSDLSDEIEHCAVEEIPGAWHGFISYTLEGKAFDIHNFWKKGHGMNFKTVNLNHSQIERPENPEYLETYFDKETKKTLTFIGDGWVDAMGNYVE